MYGPPQNVKVTGRPDLEKLRRFALMIALILITYSVAGLQVKKDEKVLGIFSITNPELIPIALVLTSAFSLMRFWYYGTAIIESPGKKRKRVRRMKGYSEWYANHDEIAQKISEYESLFPSAFGYSVNIHSSMPQVEGTPPKPDGKLGIEWLGISEPPILRLFCAFETLDYWSPVWLNTLALVSFLLSTGPWFHVIGSC